MLLKTREGVLVEAEIQYERHMEDSFFCSAVHYETGEQMHEGVINDLNEDYQQELDEAWYEHQIGRSDMAADAARDND